MSQYKKVSFYTLGCKLNFSETSTIARQFVDAGYASVDFEAQPDIYVVNTCSVTENADKKCRQLVKKALKHNPNAYIIIIGCFAQLKPEEIKQIPGVTLVLGANEKFNVVEHIEALDGKPTEGKAVYESIKNTLEFKPSYSFGDRTRSFLKIQDGCDYFCSFCTIPLARGKSRSNTVAETMKSAKEVAQTEVNEVVLTGVNIGDFGQGTNENFYDLVKELDTIEGIERFRISSIEPNLLTTDIIEHVSQSDQFVPHFHIPLQSGSNKLLKAMRRKYERELYAERILKIKELMPHCCIGVDVIVGFPGETEEDYIETFEFLQNLPVSYLHVFTYSERANTTARKMGDAVPMSIRQDRSKRLRILSLKLKRKFYEENEGKNAKVLFEAEDHDGYIHGFTENYVKVKMKYDEDLVNQVKDIKMTDLDRDALMKCEFVA